jgi:hypothetical protein
MPQADSAIKQTCLNGWWDFRPAAPGDDTERVPAGGWAEAAYLVPSVWTKPLAGVRRPGERQFHAARGRLAGDEEFLFDAFGYPASWARLRRAWVRRRVELCEPAAGRRQFLRFDAVMSRCRLFVNGEPLADHDEAMLPLVVDATACLREGENEIALLVADYERTDSGRTLRPSGNGFTLSQSGVWQDVFLVERAEVYVEDVTIRTSVRQGTLWVRFEAANASGRERTVTLRADVADWRKGIAPADAPAVLSLPPRELTVPPGAAATAEVEVPWPDAEPWYPERPKLYRLRTAVVEAGEVLEMSAERFGFREVWLDGPRLMLNDYAVHLASDWGHKVSVFHLTEAWVRKWFGMLRDAKMNHSRLHNLPHPRMYLDLADEEGILLTVETAINGAGKVQAAESREYWEAAERHVRRLVRRDKNHPSVVLWSVENEMRWNDEGQDLIRSELPRLRELIERLDPTRVAYNDGDTSLWNEKAQPLISRHYGKAGAGVGWWDRQQPLLTTEMALYHQMGPHNTLHLGGDAVYADFARVADVAGLDAQLTIEAGRALGVSCFAPWNLSCLANLRMDAERVDLRHDDFTAPGMKPLVVHPHASEFAFWKEGRGYTPNACFHRQARAFRPLAVIDTSLRTGYFAGARFRRELTVVNDTPGAVEGTLRVELRRGADGGPPAAGREGGRDVVHRAEHRLDLPRGERRSVVFDVALPEEAGDCDYAAEFRAGGEVLDEWRRPVRVRERVLGRPRSEPFVASRVAVLGEGHMRGALEALAIDHAYVESLSAEAVGEAKIVLIERGALAPGSRQNRQVRSLARDGRRVIVMEQDCSLLPALPLEGKMVLRAFARAPGHPLLAGVAEEDLCAWGDDPYAKSASDSYVALRMYRKDDSRLALYVLDSGEGNWGAGDLELSPLLEAPEAGGLLIACQLRLTDKLADIPAAEAMLLNLLRRAEDFQPPPEREVIVADGSDASAAAGHVAAARAGAAVVVNDASPEALAAWGEALGVALVPRDAGEVYSVVRKADDGLLAGVSNGDTCGVERFFYAGEDAENHRVARTVLAPAEGVEALLVTPAANCLRELYVGGGHTEPLFAHTRSRFLFAERPVGAVALARVRAGRGLVLFNQFAPPPGARVRFRRLENRLLANLGRRFEGSLLAGERVPAAGGAGDGCPRAVEVYTGPVDDALRREMLQCTHLHLEEHKSVPILNIPGWRSVQSADGVWRSGRLGAGEEAWLYYHAVSPTARVVLDPRRADGEALTSVEMAGEGEVELIVNARSFGRRALSGGQTRFEGVELQMRWNHVLVRWAPRGEDSTLKMVWRKPAGQVESDLEFKFSWP